MSEPVIRVENLGKDYGRGDTIVHALRDVNLTIDKGEFVAIMGPSGSGKTTFMNLIGCLDSPSTGRYLLNGEDVSGLDDNALAGIRNKYLGFVFQSFNLLPRQTALRNVELPLQYAGVKNRKHAAEDALTRVGLGQRMDHRPNELSGGQQQRLCIARALALRPRVLLMDEPCSALDPTSTRRIEETIVDLRSDVTIVIVTHNMQQAARVSDQCAFFLAEQGTPGVIVEHGSTSAIFENPQDQRTADYVNGRFG
jgi:ABC-type lipoprotein export system ATPase subunit